MLCRFEINDQGPGQPLPTSLVSKAREKDAVTPKLTEKNTKSPMISPCYHFTTCMWEGPHGEKMGVKHPTGIQRWEGVDQKSPKQACFPKRFYRMWEFAENKAAWISMFLICVFELWLRPSNPSSPGFVVSKKKKTVRWVEWHKVTDGQVLVGVHMCHGRRRKTCVCSTCNTKAPHTYFRRCKVHNS